MNSLSLTDTSNDDSARVGARQQIDQLDEPWFAEPPPSSPRRPSAPPVHVGEFLGDPEVDAWLR